jgi:S-formylglutathione hydrolase FrmB
MEKRLKHWAAEMDKLAQTAQSIQITQKAAFDKRAIDLQAKLDLAQNKLTALRGAGEHKWESFKEALERSVHELEKAFKS